MTSSDRRPSVEGRLCSLEGPGPRVVSANGFDLVVVRTAEGLRRYTALRLGPRLCPGRALALIEMKLVLAALYRSFLKTRRESSKPVREPFNFTMNPVGLDVRVTQR